MNNNAVLFSFHWHVENITLLRDWSLITGRRGPTQWEGGGGQVNLPLRKGGGAEKVLAMLKGLGTQCFEVVFTR